MTLEEIVDKAALMPPEEGIHGEISNPSEGNGTFKNINFKLCETTGNYIRQTPIQDFEK